ncbi:hypothetical protein CMV_011663 [Castanea mollissima]|uniref:Uncharacterized protein n=1 Tax=Castanea mollissima TaxID=60419 RepID=A0A8J4VZU7_9ROSI|nr:hypothetical protein CMV_011663 [Castanea mollissima]
MGTSKVTDAQTQTDCNDEKGIEKGVHGMKRKQCVIISEDKKEKLHEKKREACANNSVDSRKCSQNRGVGIVINEGSARISEDHSCHITRADLSNRGKDQISSFTIFEGSNSRGVSDSVSAKLALGSTESKYRRCKNPRSFLQNISSQADTLLPVPACKYCEAKRFLHESKGFCWSDGEICLIVIFLPANTCPKSRASKLVIQYT